MSREEAIMELREHACYGSERFLEAISIALDALETATVVYDKEELRRLVAQCVLMP